MTNDIETMLKTAIQMKVVEAFNSTPDMVEKLVEAALSKEVDQFGGKPDYHSKKMPYMEFLVGQEIRKAVTESVAEYVKTHKEQITERVRVAMESSDFAKPVSEKVAQIMSENYNWTIALNIAPM